MIFIWMCGGYDELNMAIKMFRIICRMRLFFIQIFAPTREWPWERRYCDCPLLQDSGWFRSKHIGIGWNFGVGVIPGGGGSKEMT